MEQKEDYIYRPILGYKGLSNEMKASKGEEKDFVFEIGKIYYKENIENPKLCSNQGYHYCRNLKDCFAYYANDGKNRFFEIEVLGNSSHEHPKGGKSITTAFRLTKEINVNQILEKEEKEKAAKAHQKAIEELDELFHLPEVRYIQTKYPHVHVGGSIALYLHGLWLSRWSATTSKDLDFVTPFYTFFEGEKAKAHTEEEFNVYNEDAKASGNDFDETFFINGVKSDVRIDPTQKYDIIELDGFRYKVSKLEVIMEAKIRYALNGQKKHRDDIFELLGKKQETHRVAGKPITSKEMYSNIQKIKILRSNEKTIEAVEKELFELPF